MPRILVLDTLSPEGLELLASSPGVEYEVKTGLKGDALREALAAADGAICRSGVKITADALAGNRRLKAIVRAGVGTDNIDSHAATRLGIVVMNTPAGNTVSTAELTIALMLALSRHIHPAYQSLIEGKWDRNRFMGTQVSGKTLGVIGLGRVGCAVAARAMALGMKVIGYNSYLMTEEIRKLNVEIAGSVDEMLPQIDYLTVHVPLTEETRNLISGPQISKIRKGARLLNVARGGIYDEAALAEGLKSGHLAGVALDVFAKEPCVDSPLFGMPGVVATPHLGASTEEAQTEVALEGIRLLLDFFATGTIRCAVNMIPVNPEMLSDMRGYLDIGYRLGLLLAQMAGEPAKRCSLQYRGEVALTNTKLITACFAAGLLADAIKEPINLVNAAALLRERGIDLVERTRKERGVFASLITVELATASKTIKAAATTLGHDILRLVEIDDFRFEAYLDGVLLVFHHRDVPGIIGTVGTIFGAHKVNIAQMAVGRANPGGDAIGVLNLDQSPPQKAIDEVLAHPAIQSATVIKLPAVGERPSWVL